jgi:acyl dehydratase
MAKYVTDEITKLIGTETEPVTWDVERGAIRRFAEALGDSNPLYADEKAARHSRFGGIIAPPTFYRSLPAARRISIPNLPSRGLDGGSEWEFFLPLRPGDRITVTTRLVEVREAEGRLGTMVFTTNETRYVNQLGELCATQRTTGIFY